MIWHLGIHFREAGAWSKLAAGAAEDRRIADLAPFDGREGFVFYPDEEMADRHRRGEHVTYVVAVLTRRGERGAFVSLEEATDASVETLAPFLAWVLRALPVEKVVDEDRGEDVTGRALEHPEEVLGRVR